MNGQLAAVRQGHGVLSGSFWATYLLWASRLQLWYVKPAEKSKADENHDAFPGCTQDLDLHRRLPYLVSSPLLSPAARSVVPFRRGHGLTARTVNTAQGSTIVQTVRQAGGGVRLLRPERNGVQRGSCELGPCNCKRLPELRFRVRILDLCGRDLVDYLPSA